MKEDRALLKKKLISRALEIININHMLHSLFINFFTSN